MKNFLRTLVFTIPLIAGLSSALANPLKGQWEKTASGFSSEATPFDSYKLSYLDFSSDESRMINLIGEQTGSIYSDKYIVINEHEVQFTDEDGTARNWNYTVENENLTLSRGGFFFGSYKKLNGLPNINYGKHAVPEMVFSIKTIVNGLEKTIAVPTYLNLLVDDYETGSMAVAFSVSETAEYQITAQVETALLKSDYNQPESYAAYINFIKNSKVGNPTSYASIKSPLFFFSKNGNFKHSINNADFGNLDFEISWNKK